jgi:uncharacterized protein (DUF2141 family)
MRTRTICLWLVALVVACGCTCAALHSRHQAGSSSATSPPSATTIASTNPTTAPTGALLSITITDVRNHKGDLVFGVFTQPDGFPNVKGKSVYWEVKPAADADRVTFTTRLPPGRYAAGVLHDENRNGDMDKNLAGIPTEGYGVTNNPKPRFRKATFDEATFTLPPEGAEMSIGVQYFLPGG